MSRYFIEISYNGSNYHGWQRQIDRISVQERLETTLYQLLKVESITGAGRTDAGVHALHYYAHFDTNMPITDDTVITLNKMLPFDIVVHAIHNVKEDANARFDAISRTYKYYILRSKNPFKTASTWYQTMPLDIDKMNQASALLIGKKDFTSFSKLHTDTKTNICTISEAYWTIEDDCLVFTISADRFLRNMVRAIVGSLFDVGRGKYSITHINTILERKDRCAAGMSVPPQGLFLWKIQYPNGYFYSFAAQSEESNHNIDNPLIEL